MTLSSRVARFWCWLRAVSVLLPGIKLVVVYAGSAIVLPCESGDAGLDLEHPPLCMVHRGPGGGDPANDPMSAGWGHCAHGVLLSSSCFVGTVMPTHWRRVLINANRDPVGLI
jgi:hypothetical protein